MNLQMYRVLWSAPSPRSWCAMWPPARDRASLPWRSFQRTRIKGNEEVKRFLFLPTWKVISQLFAWNLGQLLIKPVHATKKTKLKANNTKYNLLYFCTWVLGMNSEQKLNLRYKKTQFHWRFGIFLSLPTANCRRSTSHRFEFICWNRFE